MLIYEQFRNAMSSSAIAISKIYRSLTDETKILTYTETATFYPRQYFFWDQYGDFFPRPNFLIQRLFFQDQIFLIPRLFPKTKFSDTATDATKKLAKVSRPGSLETETLHSTFIHFHLLSSRGVFLGLYQITIKCWGSSGPRHFWRLDCACGARLVLEIPL